MKEKTRKTGRIPKSDPAVHRYTVRFNDEEHLRFLAMFDESGSHAKAVFIKKRLFDIPFRVFTEDRNVLKFYAKLSSFHSQYRAVGTNYNQVVKELRCHFSEKKAMALLYKLEQCTKELALITREAVELTKKFEEIWSQR